MRSTLPPAGHRRNRGVCLLHAHPARTDARLVHAVGETPREDAIKHTGEPVRLAPARRHRAALHTRRRRHVLGRGRAAGDRGRVRRPGPSDATLHADNGRLRRRRRLDGPFRQPPAGECSADRRRAVARHRIAAVSQAICGNSRAQCLGVAVALCASIATMLPLALTLRRPPPAQANRRGPIEARSREGPAMLGLPPTTLMVLLSIAGVGCRVALAMPEVRIVAYCTDLGYGPARGVQMPVADARLRCPKPHRLRLHRRPDRRLADALGGLHAASRGAHHVPARRRLGLAHRRLGTVRAVSGRHRGERRDQRARACPGQRGRTRSGVVIMATLIGMALGGWMSGAIFDLSGSYRGLRQRHPVEHAERRLRPALLLRRRGRLAAA